MKGVVYSMTSVIPIGYAGENEVREIAIDIRPLVRAWPELAPVLLAKRPGENALYPCVTRIENGVLYWRVTLSDTAIPGKGECVIHMIDGEGRVGKSRTMTTLIERSASGEETQEPPEAIRPWIDDVLASIESVKEGYIEIEQGEENAGLVLVVGTDGRVTLRKGGAGGDGAGVESVEQTQESTESGGKNVWTLRLTDSTTSRLIVRNGAQGAQGERGERGEQGIPGERGPTGEAGPAGPQGQAGETGPAGPQGERGPAGKDGTQGPAGESGKDGSDGVSPITSFERIDGGYRLTIKDAAGTHSVEIMDGVGVQGPAGPQGIQGPAGERGEQGERGAPFAIAKIYASQDAMNAGYATDGVPVGGFVLIETGDVSDEENARLYVKGESRYEYVTDLSGAQGIQGPEGKQGPQGPAGNPGPAGADGKDGAQGPAGPAGSDAAVTETNIQAALGYKPASETSVSQLSEKIDGKVGTTELNNAVNSALTEAKNSGAFKGDKGDKGDPGKIPVKGTDYWTEADQESIVQQVIAALGTPVFGSVDENKHITLSGHIADGTYTISFEDTDGFTTEVCTITKAPAPTYTNLFDPATATINTRMSGSSNAAKAENGYVLTATIFLPVEIPNTSSSAEHFIVVPAGMWVNSANIFYGNSAGAAQGYCDYGGNNGTTIGNWTKVPLINKRTSSSTSYDRIVVSLYVKGSAITASDIQDIGIYFDEIPG